ncbi:hypothetical protein BWI17_21950 [Betaproteobacteria bacterium GR16-43]|nr:hypothetical protein BWI17_21950 [Betaproteobacteria bacterium GR16-43]
MRDVHGIEPGARIDGFEIGERVHAGAMGTLYRVTGPDTGFPMVMKVPRLGEGEDASGLLGFEAEVTILPVLEGPQSPRFVASGAISKLPYLVMEWIEGTSLAERAAHAPIAPEAVAHVGAAIAEALHALHRQEVVHHDVKPDNVILRREGGAALIDYGLARHARFPDLLAEERRFFSGSAPYIAPEPVLGTRNDARSDLFSLGVVLYQLATGHLPFGAPRALAGLRDRLWRDPVPPATLAPIPPWLQEVILRCLETDAALRYQSAGHLAFDLRNPGQVELTARAARSGSTGFWGQAARWWRGHGLRLEHATARDPEPAPVVLVAVDTENEGDDRHPALQRAVRRILASAPEIRLVFVSVVPAVLDAGESAQLEHRMRLRSWVSPFALPPHRHSLHVLEAADAAAALLAFARANLVDLIVLGAPGPSQLRLAWWRSVASTVTSQAPCSVHVVRRPAAGHDWV